MFRDGPACFLAREYGFERVGVDPGLGNDHPTGDGRPYVEKLRRKLDCGRWIVEGFVIAQRPT
jgi:hypothetical protein